jgi:hypothetical protein
LDIYVVPAIPIKTVLIVLSVTTCLITSDNSCTVNGVSTISTNKVDVGGTITFKFDLPPGTTLNQKQLNDVFNSQDFKQYILNLNKSNNEGKNQGVVSYGK